ncbi:MAG: SDR family oxidoreductase [Pseudomonadota bacterium]
MEIVGKTAIVTGGGSGIGAAIARQLAKAGAQVVVSDRNGAAAETVAAEISGSSFTCDVGREDEIKTLIQFAQTAHGPVDIFVSNAGLGRGEPDHAASASDSDWDLNWRVHVMAHVWAARALLPDMIARKSGYFLNVASAAGLLNQIGDAAYSATKHAAVSFAESLAITHGADGIGVSVLCPQYVATPLIGMSDEDATGAPSLKTAEDVAQVSIDAIKSDRFLVLSHPQVKQYTQARAVDHDQWITGMQALRGKVLDVFGEVDITKMHKFT